MNSEMSLRLDLLSGLERLLAGLLLLRPARTL